MIPKAPPDIPDAFGCYIFKDENKKPLYVGKAKNLRARVRTYFLKNVSEKIRKLRNEATEIEIIVTNNEWEAFLLENNFIKQFHPKYNVLLRDDKTYPLIKINLKKNFPKVEFTRRIEKDDSLYFGPFVPSSNAKRNLKIIQEFFGVATCKDPLDQSRSRPCLLYEMGRCLAPCVKDKISKENYRKRIEEVLLFLEGKNDELLRTLKVRMAEAAAKQEYEMAANYRDLLFAAESLKLKQNVVFQSSGHIDFYALIGEGNTFIAENFTVIEGKIVDRKNYLFEDVELEKDELWETFLTQIYSNCETIPLEICVSEEFKGLNLVSKFLSEKCGREVKIWRPNSEKKSQIIKTLTKNGHLALTMRLGEITKLEPLRKLLGLNNLIRKIECFDVSHFQGEAPYVSLVVWKEGSFQKREYRKFALKECSRGDDYGAIAEAVYRRYKKVLEEEGELPDLILIDGGANQAQSALNSLNKLKLSVAVLGLAKKEEKLFLPRNKAPLDFQKNSPLMLVLRKIRDEAHRFAIKTSKRKIEKTRIASPLLSIKGIGEKTTKKLLKFFLTTENVLKTDKETLEKVVGKRGAKIILKWREEKKMEDIEFKDKKSKV